MRGTMKIATNTALNNILGNYSRLINVSNQMATGQRVNTPSDDALATNAGMRLDTLISQGVQYNRNIAIGQGFLSLSDASIANVNNAITTAKSLTIGAASDTTTQAMRQTNAVEMNSLLEEIITIGNRKDGSRYLFGGTNTQEEPYQIVAGRYVYYAGNNEDINIQVDHSTKMAINVTGEQVFGSLESTLYSRDLSPDINLGIDTSTRLDDLNGGNGVPEGSINIKYTAYPSTGLNIDLSEADTLEDVADIIERESIAAANKFDPLADPEYDYVLQVSMNETHDGLVISQYNRGVVNPPLLGTVDFGTDPTAEQIEIREVASNTVARDLGLLGSGSTTGLSVLVGTDVDPAISEHTLLADLEGYRDEGITITNGAKPGSVLITELDDVNNNASQWNLAGLENGTNTGRDGELYTRMTNLGPNDWQVEVFNSATMLPNDLVATGSGGSGTVVLSSANNSGVSGTVGINPPAAAVPGDTVEIKMKATFDPTFRSSISVPAFVETGTATGVGGVSSSDLVSNWHLRGLEKGVSTDANGELYVDLADNGLGDYTVSVYRDAGMTDLVASGTLNGATQGQVRLEGAPGYEQVKGSVQVEWNSGLPAGPANHTLQLDATFATVEDLINEVNHSNTYTTAQISASGNGIEISSHLGGAYLTVAENVEGMVQSGDENRMLSQVNLNGLVAGVNTDKYGNLYTEVSDIGTPPGAGPYEVRFYSDSARQNLVASGTGSVANGTIAITQQNDSGITGSVYLDYVADDTSIRVEPGGPRVYHDEYEQISQFDVTNLIPGTNSDYQGRLFMEVEDTGVPGPNQYEVRVYSDKNHNNQVAVGYSALPNGQVTLNEVNNSGIGSPTSTTDSFYLEYTADDNDIIVESGGMRIGGQTRQDNLFSTMNDTIDAMNGNDAETLHDLLGNFEVDLERVLLSRAEIGSREQRMELLTTRHNDEKINFTAIRSDHIDLDYTQAIIEYQAQTNVFEASLRTAGQIIPMSLVDFI